VRYIFLHWNDVFGFVFGFEAEAVVVDSNNNKEERGETRG
jgi:hypothetical protein